MSLSSWSETLSESVILRARSVFEKYDWDSSGNIGMEDVFSALGETGKHVNHAFLAKILDQMGLNEGTTTVRFEEFIKIVESCNEAESPSGTRNEEEKAAFAASFQWLGGNPEDPQSTISKDTIRKVLQDFELNDDVDTVLGSQEPSGSPQAGRKMLKDSLSLQDLQNAFDES